MFSVEPRGERVAVLRMDDGKVNAIGPAFVEGFPAAWADAASGGRAVVLAGNAKAFCAGLDLKVLPTLEPEAIGRFAREFLALFALVLRHPRPVVAAVDGPALAGGAILALCADFRLVTPRARLGLTEMPVGIPFPDPVLDLARATLPVQEHAPALLQGAVRPGPDCLARGWAHDVHEPAVLLDESVRLAELTAQYHASSFRDAKAALRAPVVASFERFEKHGPEAWAMRMSEPETIDAIVRYFERVTRK